MRNELDRMHLVTMATAEGTLSPGNYSAAAAVRAAVEKAILLAVSASFCTATASVCQRRGARQTGTAGGFDVWLVLRLARSPVWLLGIASMILGFVFQLTALRFGALALVQPILAVELLLVFGYMAFAGRHRVRVKPRDWLAAAAMSAGIAVFLRLASPSGGRLHAPGSAWLPGRRVLLPPRRPARRRDRDLVGFRGGGHQGTQLAPR